ncbi:hypothetical protein F5148DRAFT_1220215 [Russula earlei]|uniref:Uncharacterized protein n=1 Tax=Russula earlei TaxID=71964 RepID=A0ACC0U3T7_9AGAM|nr:hypothetical protein F5148DRAFT_1220215 [Russula earlei]
MSVTMARVPLQSFSFFSHPLALLCTLLCKFLSARVTTPSQDKTTRTPSDHLNQSCNCQSQIRDSTTSITAMTQPSRR